MDLKLEFQPKKSAIAALIGLAITFVLCFIGGVLVYYKALSPSFAPILAFAALFIGGFGACFFVNPPSKRIYYKLMTVALLYVMLLIVGFAFPDKFSFQSAIYMLIILSISAIMNTIVTSINH